MSWPSSACGRSCASAPPARSRRTSTSAPSSSRPGAVRLDGASTHYAPIEYPAVAHPDVVQAAAAAAASLGVPFRTGVSASSDTFYPGQERYDSFSGYVPRRFQGITEEWRRLHVLNYEMESSTVLTLTAAMGLRGGCVAGRRRQPGPERERDESRSGNWRVQCREGGRCGGGTPRARDGERHERRRASIPRHRRRVRQRRPSAQLHVHQVGGGGRRSSTAGPPPSRPCAANHSTPTPWTPSSSRIFTEITSAACRSC